MQPLIDGSKSRFREWFRKVWDVRGGGLYAVGFAAVFIYLEVVDLAVDIADIGSIGGAFDGGVINFAIAFMIEFFLDSLLNTFQALLWPVDVVQWAPPWGAVALGLAYWLFPSYAKPHIENWLFDGEPEEAEEPESTSS